MGNPQPREQRASIQSNLDGAPPAQGKVLPLLYRGLVICLVVLAVILIGGTIYGISISNAAPARQDHIDIAEKSGEGEGQTFSALGRIRLPTADPQPGTVILFVSFIYYPDDKAFSEELVLRIADFREIITAYVSSFSSSELQKLGEESLKDELLRRFNAVLRLGQIETLFFTDFMIIG